MSKNEKNGSKLPDGFVPVRSRLDGFYKVAEGNAIQGVLVGSYSSEGEYGPKTVYKVKVTNDKLGTIVTDDGGPRKAVAGDIIGIDEKGWLKGLADIDEGTTIYVVCTGQGEATAGRSAPWKFEIGQMPA